MEFTRVFDGRRMNAALNGELLEKVDCFKYLGFKITRLRKRDRGEA